MRHSLLASLFLVTACGSVLGTSSKPQGIFRDDKLWTRLDIPLCIVNPETVPAEWLRWAKAVVRDSYARSPIQYWGWERCPENDFGWVKVLLTNEPDSSPRSYTGLDAFQHFGRHSRWGTFDVVLDFHFTHQGGWADICTASEQSRRDCIKQQAIHELGHAAGLVHEQVRLDSTCVGHADSRTASPNDVAFGPYDAGSIMSYCRSGIGHGLSVGDVATLWHAYGNQWGQGKAVARTHTIIKSEPVQGAPVIRTLETNDTVAVTYLGVDRGHLRVQLTDQPGVTAYLWLDHYNFYR